MTVIQELEIPTIVNTNEEIFLKEKLLHLNI